MASAGSYQPIPATADAAADAEKQEAAKLDEDKGKMATPSGPEKHTEDQIIAQKLKILIVVTSYFVVSM